MKGHETVTVIFFVVALLFTACSGSGDTATDVAPTASFAEATAEPTATATPNPRAAVTEEELVDAARAQLDADIAGGIGPSGTFAYDLLDAKVADTGNVTLTIGAWEGDTVFDTVRDSLFRTNVGDDGAVTASHITTPVAPGECVNTQLIESALDTIVEYDSYSRRVVADPMTFAESEAESLLSKEFLEVFRASIESHIEQDVHFPFSRPDGDLVSSAAADLLWRRFRVDGVSVVEIAVCRAMNPKRGTYRDGVLIDDGRSDSSPGFHSVDSFQLVPSDDALSRRWQVAGGKSLIWTDCFGTGDWPAAASSWQERETPFEVLLR